MIETKSHPDFLLTATVFSRSTLPEPSIFMLKTAPRLYQQDVRNMYESLPFPLRNPADEEKRLLVTPPDALPKINHYCFKGRKTFDSRFRALVAGGGTGDAAIYLAEQLRDYGGSVTYLDMSAASMEIAQHRAAVRDLDNIEWINASLLDIPALNLGRFDYINCVGVLHHLDVPADGLRCLESVLAENGAMCLMVYGRHGRLGVTIVQEILKHIVGDVTSYDEKLAVANALLHYLPPTNAYMAGRDRAYVLKTLGADPNNLADLFLHPCDHPFTAAEFLAMIEQSGLSLSVFTTYDGNPAVTRLQYSPFLLAGDEVVKQHLAAMPYSEQLDVAEMMDGSLHLHAAYVTRGKNCIADFSDYANIPFIPDTFAAHAIAALLKRGNEGLTVQLSCGAEIALKPAAPTLAFLRAIDGKTPLRKIMADLTRDNLSFTELSRDLSTLNALDWVLLRHESIGAFPLIGTQQYEEMDAPASAATLDAGRIIYRHPLL